MISFIGFVLLLVLLLLLLLLLSLLLVVVVVVVVVPVLLLLPCLLSLSLYLPKLEHFSKLSTSLSCQYASHKAKAKFYSGCYSLYQCLLQNIFTDQEH